MARIAKILPLPVEFKPGEQTMRNALAERGWMRHPGSGIGIVPIKVGNKKYLTGLDENAEYIKKIPDEKAREIERAIVAERRKRLQDETGLDLSPTSSYYADVYKEGVKPGETAQRVKLMDKENVFNFSNPEKEIEFWWVAQHTNLIAPSLEVYKKGGMKQSVQFYVSNPEAEASVVYSDKKAANDAIVKLDKMSIEKRKKVGKLLGLPITDNDKEEMVYNYLDTFIRSGTVKDGEFKGQRSVKLFNDISGLNDKLLNVRTLVKDALLFRVFIKRQGVVYEGEIPVAQSEEELIRDMALDSKSMEYLALETKVQSKRKLREGLS